MTTQDKTQDQTPTPTKQKKDKTPLHPALTKEEAAWVAQNARPAESPCLCGCGRTTKTRFAPGHDAVLKSRLARTVAVANGGQDDAEAALAVFGW